MRFYGQFTGPSVDEYLYKTFFKNKMGGFFIECGAANGISDSSCKFFEESMNWRGINIEAHPEIFQQLKNNRPKGLNLNNGLTSAEEDGKLLKFNAYDFLKKNKIFIDEYGPHAPIGFLDSAKKERLKHGLSTKNMNSAGQLDVIGLSYKSLIEQYKVEKVDLFVLDVEGSELDVISGMKGSSVLPKIMCVESNKVEMPVLNSRLSDLGYDFYSTIHVNSHYIRRN